MALWLQEADVDRLLAMDDVIAAVEQGFRWLGEGVAANQPRTRAITPQGVLHVMHAAVPPLGVGGVKAYATGPGGARFVALLYRLEDGELLLAAEADRLGQLRTGAASAVATKVLARPAAGALAVIGSGWQARTQVQAIARVRPIALVKVYSRTPERREAFAAELVEALGVEAVAVESAQEAVAGVDVIVTITSAREPVLHGAWLAPGVHINAAGSNAAGRAELDAEAVRLSQLIAVDALDQARVECGDLLAAERAGDPVWSRVVELGAVVAGRQPGRTQPEQITLFESQGIAVEDVVTLELLYRRAVAAGAGRELPTSRPAARVRR
jgi:ornithine cyclodeaminase/alanine dehydrogenase-like protein (mu-crystallin family)